jgi:hypothetical protein
MIAIVLMVTSITLMATPVVAQNENAAHGGQATGYMGPTTIPSDAPSNTLIVETNPYLSVSPNPTGINQYVLVNFWNTPPPSNDRFLAKYQVDITKPDGSTDTIGPLNSYIADGTCWAEYTLDDQVGTWEFKFSFPGEYFPDGYYVDGEYSATNVAGSTHYPAMYYKPSTSVVTELTVVAEQVLSWPPSPLPTDYWTRPISPQNREWYAIAGVYPWPFTNWNRDDYGPWLTVPNSSHIVWYDVQQIDGIIGGDTFKDSVTTSPAQTYVTYAGRGYQTKYVPIDGVPTECAVCFDLRTGEQYYAIPTSEGGVTPFIVAYYPPGYSATLGSYQSARYELLGGSIHDQRERQVDNTLYKINPATGAVSSYPAMTGLFYNGQFVLSVQDLGAAAGENRYRLINWTTSGTSSNFASRVLNNISFPLSAIGGWNDWDLGITVQTQSFTEGAIFGGTLTAVSTLTGNVLWTKDLGTETMFNSNRVGVCAEGKLAICMENRHFNCWDLYSGNLLWTSELTEYPWGDFWSYDSSYYNGLLIAGSYEGVYAFNMTNGKIVWNYKANSVPYETPYDEYSFHSASFVADGKFFTWADEHTITQPVTRGWKWYCLNATTGEKIWSLQGFNTISRYSVVGIGDGYLMLPDQYTGTQWVVGKGKSATTVTAPDVSVPLGTGFTIKGSVLDMSPAQPGTPCVSADSMELQMEYLHMQMPIDGLWHNESITGVPVSLTAIASDGTVTDLGSVTTNGYYGTFSMSWTPPAEGKYEIIASFAADDSYGSSAAATAVTVGPAAAVPSNGGSGTEAAPDNTMLLYGILVAVIIAIVLAVVAIVAIFGKR